MSYIPSVNIELNTAQDFEYIITENARLVAGNIANSYNSGHHSFSIIGTYGTGKSSFILALQDDLENGRNAIINKSALGKYSGFDFLNIVGDYAPLSQLISKKLGTDTDNSIGELNAFYQRIRKGNRFLIIVVDEFGKILEHAAKNNPEKELYFLQQLAEFVNGPSRSIILLTTLHQNFGSYGTKLTESQRNEWQKIKGRFQEIVFAEPVEQLLALTANRLGCVRTLSRHERLAIDRIYKVALQCGIISKSFNKQTAESLFPLDPVSAVCLTIAIQRYGQNERSLFSFLSATGLRSINDFIASEGLTYNVASVFDYISYYFFSAINETNADSMGWRSLSVAIERVIGLNLCAKDTEDCLKMVKTIGLINMFFNGIVLDSTFLSIYGEAALNILNPEEIINELISYKIIRFAKYKSQYILFEGTNIDLDVELYKAASVIPVPSISSDELAAFFKQRLNLASASFYRTGTPRYFEYILTNKPQIKEPAGDIDGYIYLIFPLEDIEQSVIDLSLSKHAGASIFVYFKNIDPIVKHIYEIKKIQYVIDNVAFDDRVAKAELENQKAYEVNCLNEFLNSIASTGAENVHWYFNGTHVDINSTYDFNKLLTRVCETIYSNTPIIRNELFNRQKLSSAISLARVRLLDAMLDNSDKDMFGIEGYPPEKTLYMTLFRESGIHHKNSNGDWVLGAATNEGFKSLWDVSCDFIESCVDKPRKLIDLVKILQHAPYKLKQGVIDLWIPIFLFIKQQELALYNGTTFILALNREVFELIQKRISDFSIRAFKISGVKLEFFKRYRQFLHKEDDISLTSSSLLETVKPFFRFYRNLNNYAKTTCKFDSAYTARFRDVISNATDPVKAFFEDLPAAMGYKELCNDEFVEHYLNQIRNAVKELNKCYEDLIDRIEQTIVEHFGLPNEFEDYKNSLESRYHGIDPRILTPKSRAFLERIMSPSESKREFIEKLAIVITDKRLDEIRDVEEPILIHQMTLEFSGLERLSGIGHSTEDDNEAFCFELASNDGGYSRPQTYRLPKNKTTKANRIIQKIEEMLPGEEDLDICILLKILKNKIR